MSVVGEIRGLLADESNGCSGNSSYFLSRNRLVFPLNNVEVTKPAISGTIKFNSGRMLNVQGVQSRDAKFKRIIGVIRTMRRQLLTLAQVMPVGRSEPSPEPGMLGLRWIP